MSVEQRTLERFKYAIQEYLDAQLVNELADMPAVEFQQHVSFIGDELLLALRGKMLGETLERISASYPVNWWEAVKARFFPEWAKKRWPIQYAKIELEARALYPRLSLPKEPHFITLMMDGERYVKS